MGPKAGERKARFSENERVLCFQGPLIYEAKCLKSDTRDDKYFYFIHYNGWNKHWDEWVPESRLLKHNETNLQKQKDLLKRCGKDKKKTSRKEIKSIKNERDNVEKRKLVEPFSPSVLVHSLAFEPEKKKAHVTVEEVVVLEDRAVRPIQVTIPKDLRLLLANDWEYICQRKQLFHLPAKTSVHQILKKYMEDNISTSEDISTMKEMVSGIQEYFNVMLGSQLLYKFERPQYGDILEKFPQHTVSQIYGAFHFLRFFVQIESVLSSKSNIHEKSIELIIHYIHGCLKFLCDNKAEFFDVNEYEIAPAEYHRRAIT